MKRIQLYFRSDRKSSHTNAYAYLFIYWAFCTAPQSVCPIICFFYSVQKSHPAFPVLTCHAHNAEGERQIVIALHDEKEDKMQRSGSIWIYIYRYRSIDVFMLVWISCVFAVNLPRKCQPAQSSEFKFHIQLVSLYLCLPTMYVLYLVIKLAKGDR